MKNGVLLSIVILLYSLPALSQVSSEDNPKLKTFGIGLTFKTYELNLFNWIQAPNLIFSFNLNEQFRLEPEFGMALSKMDYSNDYHEYNNYYFGVNSSLIFNLERFYITPGFRLGYTLNNGFLRRSTGEEEEWKGSQWVFGPIVGFEFVLFEHLGIGGDFGFLYNTENADNTWDGDELKYKDFITATELKVRFYF